MRRVVRRVLNSSGIVCSVVGGVELSRRSGTAECGWLDWWGYQRTLNVQPNDIYVWGRSSCGIDGAEPETILLPTRLAAADDDSCFHSVALGPSWVVATTAKGELLVWEDLRMAPIVLHQVVQMNRSGQQAIQHFCSHDFQIVAGRRQ